MLKVTLVGLSGEQRELVRHTIIESEPLAEMGGKISFAQPFQLLLFEGDPVAITSLVVDGKEAIEGEPLESHLVRDMRERGAPIELPTGRNFAMTVRPIGPATGELGPTPPGYEAPPAEAQAAVQQAATGKYDAAAWERFAGGFIRTGRRENGNPVLVFCGHAHAIVECEPAALEFLLPGIEALHPDPQTRAATLLAWLLWGPR